MPTFLEWLDQEISKTDALLERQELYLSTSIANDINFDSTNQRIVISETTGYRSALIKTKQQFLKLSLVKNFY